MVRIYYLFKYTIDLTWIYPNELKYVINLVRIYHKFQYVINLTGIYNKFKYVINYVWIYYKFK